MAYRKKLFLVLWLAGMLGVLSLLRLTLPIPEGMEMPVSPQALRWLILIQPTVLLSLAVFGGVVLAHRVGLSAPVAEAIAGGQPVMPALKPQVIPGFIGGLAGGLAISGAALLWLPRLPQDFVAKATEFARAAPLETRVLYGGITEELLIRWGLMTLFVWVAWRWQQKGEGRPRPRYFIWAIALTSVIFGLGHLPVAFALSAQVTASLVAYVIALNTLFGVIAGYLYWRKGLEAAIIAHALAHVVMLTADFLVN